ncbi:MAG: hypothetical protein ABUS54_09480 [Actinomycetota bacterium]
MQDFWERYLVLGLRLGRHVDGLVDAYFGPEELRTQVEAEPLAEPGELAAEAASLRAAAQTLWQREQLLGCETTARRLAGEEIGWADEVERCYGVAPRRTDESVFEDAHERLEAVLPGDGELADRYRAWLEGHALPKERILEAATRLADVLRTRTVELFGLPDDESARIEIVQDEPWAGFNYYLGGRRSRVVINTDLPVYAPNLPGLVAHEVYPGHHTEHAWKEVLLVDGEGNLGETIFLVGTPQSTISEGIASLAGEIVGADELAPAVYADLGVAYDHEGATAVRTARQLFDGAAVNAALLIHEDGRSLDDAAAYLARWTLVPFEHARKRTEFIVHPTWRAYISCYANGYDLCKRWVAGDMEKFRRLLTEQLSTGDLAA